MKNDLRGRSGPREAGEQACAGHLHRLRLHELPLDEGEHVHAAGDRRGRCRTSSWSSSTPTAPTRRATPIRSCRNRQFKTVAIPFYAIFDGDQRRRRQVRGFDPQRSRLPRVSSYPMKTVSHGSARVRTLLLAQDGHSRLFRGTGAGRARAGGQSARDPASPNGCAPTWSEMSAEPHIAGSPASKAVAEYTAGLFREWGLDVQIEEFEALLPYPKSRLLEMTAPVKFTAKLQEPRDSGRSRFRRQGPGADVQRLLGRWRCYRAGRLRELRRSRKITSS